MYIAQILGVSHKRNSSFLLSVSINTAFDDISVEHIKYRLYTKTYIQRQLDVCITVEMINKFCRSSS